MHDGLLGLPLAHHRAAAAGDGRVRGGEGAAGRLDRGQLRQGVRMPSGRQGQGRVRRAPVARPRFPPGAPGHRHRAEQGSQRPAVPGLQAGPGDPVGARHRGPVLAGLLFLPHFPQVVVVLEQLFQDRPAPLVQELLQFGGREHGCRGAGELGGQHAEHVPGRRERIIRGNCAVRCHGGSFFLEVRIWLAPPNLGRRTRYRPRFAVSRA